ncbi:branched-chain alpha-keto acid dehydrogenase subunit E2 [Rhodococcus sp. WMMA185]|uniref:dihydrolipoamide acetyltransferase family protein n=1 Tax=Rhodococcus sp. WMMA185 TaxID=679318 RepID=UPI0008781CED|nr:dihydrolipoamide acetyltransferase family protein [Rhodococcus sp. WMMA185]AOW93618.1 branched-chain alpha-keto acid dehydrogenase subunit E2 [Rhodococcus sp. WMMA185]
MIEFTLPSLGADMDEGRLNEWLVSPGDSVERGQVIAVVETTKAAVEVECWHEGTVHELLVPVGQTVPVGMTIATLLEPGEEAPTSPVAAREPAEAERPVRTRATPAARREAAARGIDLASLTGTGPEGAVTLDDVEAAAAPAAPIDRTAETRRAIAAAMSRSKREIPHYYLTERISLAHTLDWLSRVNADRSVTERLLPVVLQIKAVALAAKKYPDMNGFWRGDGFESADAVHVGVAIALRQGGLVAPAIHDVADKSLEQIAGELADLVRRVRSGSMRSSEMSDPTLTVTSLGDEGVESVIGVIYPPQVALVGFGRTVERPWADGTEIRVVPTVVASLAADHRVSDGRRGALFLSEVADLLEHPERL